MQSSIIRDVVDLKQMPKVLQNATIAIEDENFYEHDGVDYSAVVRAALENVEAGEVKQGGSTITQQLVRNLYIEDPEDTIKRKIIEAEMAREYEDEHTKQEILGEYLNTASYGTNDGKTAIGVQAASQVFFNKDVSELDLDEAALLAGLPQAPTDYNPFINPEGAERRRNQVLDAMVEQGYISPASAERARSDGLGLERGYRYESRTQQYFFDFVQQELIDEYGVQTAREGGSRSTRRSTRGSRPWPSKRSPRTRPPAPRRRSSPPTSTPARSSRWRRRSHTRTASSTWLPRAGGSPAPRSSPTRW